MATSFFDVVAWTVDFSFDLDLLSSTFYYLLPIFGGLSMTTPLGPERVFLGDIFAGDFRANLAGVFGFFSSGSSLTAWILDLDTFSLLFFLFSGITAIMTSSLLAPFLKIIGSGDALYYLELFLFSILRGSGEALYYLELF